MKKKSLHFRINAALSKRWVALTLFLMAGLTAPIELGSETITLSTTYPSPVGIYARLITTGGTDGTNPLHTFLARDNPFSFVGIGTTKPQTKLDVNGLIKMGTDNSTQCTGANPGEPNLIGAVRWFIKNGDPNSPSLQVCDGSTWMIASLSNPRLIGSNCTTPGNSTFETVQCSCPGVQGSLVWNGTQKETCTTNSDGTSTWQASGPKSCPTPYNYTCP